DLTPRPPSLQGKGEPIGLIARRLPSPSKGGEPTRLIARRLPSPSRGGAGGGVGLVLCGLLLFAATALAASSPNSRLAVLPPQLTLAASRSAIPELSGQRLLVEHVTAGHFSGDVTAGAAFRS